MIFPIVMYEYESWTIRKAKHRRIDAFKLWLSRTLESCLDCKIKPDNPKGNQPWIFIGRTHAEAEAIILWPPNVQSWLIGNDPDAGKEWRQKGTREAENEIIRITDSMDTSLNKHQEIVVGREAWYATVHGVPKSQTRLSDWITTLSAKKI